MLVKDLIDLLQKCPTFYTVALSLQVTTDLPLLIDLFPEDFETDEQRCTLEIDCSISDDAHEKIDEMIEQGVSLKEGEVIVLTRAYECEQAVEKMSTKERMKHLGITVLTNELLVNV